MHQSAWTKVGCSASVSLPLSAEQVPRIRNVRDQRRPDLIPNLFAPCGQETKPLGSGPERIPVQIRSMAAALLQQEDPSRVIPRHASPEQHEILLPQEEREVLRTRAFAAWSQPSDSG